MRVVEAKDFLVQQTVEQAALENVPLSDLEKRMMYFTETGKCPEDPIALNDAFEAEHDTDEYETKVSNLMHHAYLRVKKENPETLHRWKEAMRQLSKGDHYILVLCQDGSPRKPTRISPNRLSTLGILILVVFVTGTYFALPAMFGRYGFSWRGQERPTTVRPVPLWAQRSIVVLMIGAYFLYVAFPWLSDKLREPLTLLISRITGKHQRTKNGE